jgi:hypothetical protein
MSDDLGARYIERWKNEYTPAVNGEEPRMLTAQDRLAAAFNSREQGKPSAAVDVRGVAGPKPAGDIAGEGGNTDNLIDIAKGAARTAVELFGFPGRAMAELGASGAGSRMIMGASQQAPPGYGVGDDLAMGADIGPLDASPEHQAKIQQVIDNAFEEAKTFIAGAPTEGSEATEQVLGFPFQVLSYPAQKVGEYVLELTGDPFIGKAAELATLTGTFKAAHAAGKIKAEDLGKLKEMIPGKLLEERGSLDLTPKKGREVKPADWDAFEKSLRAPIEGKPGRLNYDRMAIPDSVKEVMAGVDQLYGKRIEETIGAPHALKDVYEAAKANPMTIPELLKHPDNKPMTDVDITRARLLHGAVASYTREMAEKVKAGDVEASGMLDAALALTARIQEKKEATTAATARGLGAHRIMAEVGDYQAAGLTKYAENLARLKSKGIDGKTVAEAILNMETPEQLATFAKGLQRATTPQMFLEVWINGLLSGPQTHAANMTGNLATMALLVEERQMAAALPSWGKEPGVAMGEAGAMVHGAVLGVVDGLRLAAKTIKTGEDQFGSGKVEALLTKNQQPMRKAISAENLSVSGPMGTYVDYLGDVIRLPGTFLTAEDALFKSMAQRMELHAQAYRRATAEGLKGEAFGKRVQELLDAPKEEMYVSAAEFADYATFTKALGETGQAAQRFINSHPMLKLFLPFYRTPTNIMKFVGERTPLGLLSESVRSDIARGGATGQLAVAKLVNGSLIMGASAVLAQGGYITGSGPKNRAQRDLWLSAGWQPYSLNIGGKYYDMSRLEPVGTLMGIAADIALINEFNQGEVDEKDIEDLAVASALAGYQVFSMKSYLSGVGGWMEAINDPDRHGSRVINQLAGSVIPSAVSQPTHAYVDPHIREVRGAVDAVMARIPGLSDNLEPRLDLFGRPRLRPGRLGPDVASPVRVSEAKKDPVLDEMNRLGMAIGMPSRFVMGRRPGGTGMFGVGEKDSPWHGVELKPKEYGIYVKLAGNAYKEDTEFGRVGAYDFLKAAMKSEEYKALPEDPSAPIGTKQAYIKKVIYQYRMAAQEFMAENSGRLQKIRTTKEMQKMQFGETGKTGSGQPVSEELLKGLNIGQ